MKWILILVVSMSDGTRMMHEPTEADWWNCRMSEMRSAAGWTGHYDGNRIIGAVCMRVPDVPTVAMKQCKSEARTCA